MGSCCSITIRKNKVSHDQDTEETDSCSMCSTPESELYLERITHIVADIHETVRHKDCTVRSFLDNCESYINVAEENEDPWSWNSNHTRRHSQHYNI